MVRADYRRLPSRSGFTLVELLVVAALLAMVVSLLLPAVQSTRAAARNVRCKSNLRQVGLGVYNYLSAHFSLPPSFVVEPGTVLTDRHGVWSVHARILPYLEEGSAFDRIDFHQSWKAPANRGIPVHRVPIYICPNELNDRVRTKKSVPYVHPHTYGFNMGTWFIYDPRTEEIGAGAFAVNTRLRSASFSDGMSHTLCASEVKGFTSYFRNTRDPGPSVPSTTSFIESIAQGAQFKLGANPDDNTGHTVWCDGRVHHSGFTTVFTPNTKVPYVDSSGHRYDVDCSSRQEGKSLTQPTYAAVTSRSYHAGFVHAVMMDGSVRVVDDSVDQLIWRGMGSRDGNERATSREVQR